MQPQALARGACGLRPGSPAWRARLLAAPRGQSPQAEWELAEFISNHLVKWTDRSWPRIHYSTLTLL